MLTKITYPTGGYSTFHYETVMDRDGEVVEELKQHNLRQVPYLAGHKYIQLNGESPAT